MKHESFNESSEMYLKTVYELGGGAGLVSIALLAERLGVSAVSATEMVHRLQQQKLLHHVPYKGVGLTETGRQAAGQLIRTHHLWERLLADVLHLPWEEVHDYACRLEHATDTAVTEALAAFLQYPATCPHGNPIHHHNRPAAPTPHAAPLHTLQPGQQGVVQRISPESAPLLSYVASLGLTPGTAVTVQEIAPFNGPIMVRSCAQLHALGREAAAHIYIQLEGEPP